MAFRRRLGLAPPVISAHTSARQRGGKDFKRLSGRALICAANHAIAERWHKKKKSAEVKSVLSLGGRKRPVPAGHIPPTLQRLFMKNLAIPSPVRYNKTTRRGKAFTSRISLTALSIRKAPRPYGQPGQMPNMATLLPY